MILKVFVIFLWRSRQISEECLQLVTTASFLTLSSSFFTDHHNISRYVVWLCWQLLKANHKQTGNSYNSTWVLIFVPVNLFIKIRSSIEILPQDIFNVRSFNKNTFFVTGSIPCHAIGFFNWPRSSDLIEISTGNLPRGKRSPVLKADNFAAICDPIV
jgi:hypothetical protein